MRGGQVVVEELVLIFGRFQKALVSFALLDSFEAKKH